MWDVWQLCESRFLVYLVLDFEPGVALFLGSLRKRVETLGLVDTDLTVFLECKLVVLPTGSLVTEWLLSNSCVVTDVFAEGL